MIKIFRVRKKLIAVAVITLLCGLSFYIYKKRTLPHWIRVEEKPLQLEKINTYIKNNKNNALAYLAVASYVPQTDLKKKYLNLALKKDPTLSLAYTMLLDTSDFSGKKLDEFLDRWIQKAPENADPYLWKVKLYFDAKNFQNSYMESKKLSNKTIHNQYEPLYKMLLKLGKLVGYDELESRSNALQKINYIKVALHRSFINRESIEGVVDTTLQEKAFKTMLNVSKPLSKDHTLLYVLIGNVYEIQYWEYRLETSNKNIRKKLQKRVYDLKKQDKCLDYISKSAKLANYMNKLSKKDLCKLLDQLAHQSEYNTHLALDHVQKFLLQKNCFLKPKT